jgi:2-hydroxychromene-2-carboxylate isomerase
VPNKRAYVIKDLEAWANYYRIEFNFPVFFPLNSVKLMRGALAAKEKGKAAAYTHKLFALYMVEGKDLNQDDILKNAVTELGLDADWFMRRIVEQDIKDKLRKETDELVKRGGFGVPTFFIGEIMFWGNDRLVFVEEYLRVGSQGLVKD